MENGLETWQSVLDLNAGSATYLTLDKLIQLSESQILQL